jgi:aerobic-type carbon monoxide dehydrogenase small subunit (CoxS/CutS family)
MIPGAGFPSPLSFQEKTMVRFKVNGEAVSVDAKPETPLLWAIREKLNLTGTKFGCGIAQCGACTVHVDGEPVRGCVTPLAAVGARPVTTIEGLTESGEAEDLQAAFVARNAAQCGFCTPGMVMAAADILRQHPDATRDEIREHLSGNYCRCTGYQAIVDAVEQTLAARRGTLS